MINGNTKDINEFFSIYCNFFKDHGYDTVSFEECIAPILPDGGSLSDAQKTPAMRDRLDFERYPWAEIEDIFF